MASLITVGGKTAIVDTAQSIYDALEDTKYAAG